MVWRPILDFEKNMKYEATKVYGAYGDGTLFCYTAVFFHIEFFIMRGRTYHIY